MTSPQIAKLLESLKQPTAFDNNASKDDSYVKVNDLAKKSGCLL